MKSWWVEQTLGASSCVDSPNWCGPDFVLSATSRQLARTPWPEIPRAPAYIDLEGAIIVARTESSRRLSWLLSPLPGFWSSKARRSLSTSVSSIVFFQRKLRRFDTEQVTFQGRPIGPHNTRRASMVWRFESWHDQSETAAQQLEAKYSGSVEVRYGLELCRNLALEGSNCEIGELALRLWDILSLWGLTYSPVRATRLIRHIGLKERRGEECDLAFMLESLYQRIE